MNVLLLEPYYTGSHQAWADGLETHSQHRMTVLTLPGRWWKWRMHGGAVSLAGQANAWYAVHGRPDLILATDMLDLTSFLALTRGWSARVPVALYMHENQLTYPLPPSSQESASSRRAGERDLHYAFINYTSMLAADAILFNSGFHLDAWFSALPRLLARLPDHNELDSVTRLRAKSSVLPVGLDLMALDEGRSSGDARGRRGEPLIVWNHRWEYDKDPETFFHALVRLARAGRRFQVAVCGEMYRRTPAEFGRARQELEGHIVQWGRVEPREAYAGLLRSADIVVSTALHDFFGAAVVEAIYCGCRPVLPDRLAYPEHIPPEFHDQCLYQGLEGLVSMLDRALDEPRLDLRSAVTRYDWATMAPRYDRVLARIAERDWPGPGARPV